MTLIVQAYEKLPRRNQIQCRKAAVNFVQFCGKSTAGGSVFNWERSFSSGKETARVAVCG